MKGGFFLDIVVAEGTAVFKLFAGENKTLLIGGDAFFILDLCLDIFNGVIFASSWETSASREYPKLQIT